MNDENGKGDTGKSPEKAFKFYEMKPSSKTYISVASCFFQKNCQVIKDDFPGLQSRIYRISKVDIPHLSARYEAQKKLMEANNGGKTVREEYLFHGTTQGSAYFICQEGFRLPSKPHQFGYSICFARDSRISNYFATCNKRTKDPSQQSGTPGTSLASSGVITVQPPVPDRETSLSVVTPHAPRNCSHYMFLCKVLVGDSAHGEQFRFIKHPPSRPDDPNRLYNSCEGRGKTIGQVAVFNPDQVFPEYLISYDNRLLSKYCDNSDST